MQMKNSKRWFVVLVGIGFISGIARFYFVNNETKARAVSNHIVSKADMRRLPENIRNIILDSSVSSESYTQKVSKLEINAQKHLDIGRDIYTLALSKGFYSSEKLRLLKIAKAHLILSKTTEAR